MLIYLQRFQNHIPLFIQLNFVVSIRRNSHPIHLPVIGFVHAVHLLANNSPKHSAQYGLSSRLVKRWPAKDVEQWVHVKHSRCHGSFLYVTPPDVIICSLRDEKEKKVLKKIESVSGQMRVHPCTLTYHWHTLAFGDFRLQFCNWIYFKLRNQHLDEINAKVRKICGIGCEASMAIKKALYSEW